MDVSIEGIEKELNESEQKRKDSQKRAETVVEQDKTPNQLMTDMNTPG
jgi:hypothetical protein